MANLLIGLGLGFVAGAIAMAILAETWIQRYTKIYDGKKAEFGNTRYQEGWTQGREALTKEKES